MSKDIVGRPMEILLVEDGLMDARVTIEALRGGGIQHRLTLIRDGEEALAFLLEDPLHRLVVPLFDEAVQVHEAVPDGVREDGSDSALARAHESREKDPSPACTKVSRHGARSLCKRAKRTAIPVLSRGSAPRR